MKLETSRDLLERIRAKHNNVSWYRLQRMVPTSETTMANWKNGRSSIDRKFVTRIAALLEEPPEYVLACVENERTPDADVQKLWHRIATKFRSHAASILFVLCLSSGGSALLPQQVRAAPPEGDAPSLYIMLHEK
jgi:hypothetical protein